LSGKLKTLTCIITLSFFAWLSQISKSNQSIVAGILSGGSGITFLQCLCKNSLTVRRTQNQSNDVDLELSKNV